MENCHSRKCRLEDRKKEDGFDVVERFAMEKIKFEEKYSWPCHTFQ